METLTDVLPILSKLVSLALLILAVPFVLGPVLIKFSQRLRANATLIAFDPNVYGLPHDVVGFFQGCTESLQLAGFSVVTYASLPDQTPGVFGLLLLLENRENEDLAVATAMFPTMGSPGIGPASKAKFRQVEFSNEFANGSEICTTNARASAFAPVEHKRVLRFPDVQDPALLYQLHRQAVAELARSTKRPLPATEALLEFFRHEMVKEMAEQVGTGYLYLDQATQEYRPTWKGAVLMTWKNAWPVTAIRLAAHRRRAQSLMARWAGSPQL